MKRPQDIVYLPTSDKTLPRRPGWWFSVIISLARFFLQVLGPVNSLLPVVHLEEGLEIRAVPSFYGPTGAGMGEGGSGEGGIEAFPWLL